MPQGKALGEIPSPLRERGMAGKLIVCELVIAFWLLSPNREINFQIKKIMNHTFVILFLPVLSASQS